MSDQAPRNSSITRTSWSARAQMSAWSAPFHCYNRRTGIVIGESFDELKAGFVSKPVPFAGDGSLGSYDHLVRSADAFGGAGGKGTYMSVNWSLNAGSNPTTLVLATPQRYFGLWWRLSSRDMCSAVPVLWRLQGTRVRRARRRRTGCGARVTNTKRLILVGS